MGRFIKYSGDRSERLWIGLEDREDNGEKEKSRIASRLLT